MSKNTKRLENSSSKCLTVPFLPGGGGALPSKRLMEMCCWMGSHCHNWIDYNGVLFSIELLEWGCIFSGFGSKNINPFYNDIVKRIYKVDV